MYSISLILRRIITLDTRNKVEIPLNRKMGIEKGKKKESYINLLILAELNIK